MKTDVHPEYGASVVHCGCGNTWETRSTKPDLRVEICSVCHPFFTGEQRIIDTAGRVERFRQRYGIRDTEANAEENADADPASADATTADAAGAEA